jgi:hypothetical protein
MLQFACVGKGQGARGLPFWAGDERERPVGVLPRDGGVIGMLDATNCEWRLSFSTDCRYSARLVTNRGSAFWFATDRRISAAGR